MLCGIPCAAALYRFRAELSLDIFPILWTVTSIFFAVVLIRQLITLQGVGGEAHPMGDEKPTGLSGLALALAVTGLAYARIVPLYFTSDDFSHLSLVRQPFLTSIWPEFTHGQVGANWYRPLGFASLFLDYRLWHTWAPGYHLTNLVMHLFCVTGVFFLCREIRLTNEACTIAALFFGVLPVGTQAVAWIACRFDLLATIFMLWSLVFAAKFRRTGRTGAYIWAIAFFLLAALTKESAYVLPVLWVALELLPLEEQQQSPRHLTKSLLPLLGYFVVAGLAFLHRHHVLGGIGGQVVNGSPAIMSFGAQSWIGVLVRGPSAMLLGNNIDLDIWSNLLFEHRSPVPFLVLLVLTAALLLAMALLSVGKTSFRRTIWFSLIWVFVSTISAHFYFANPDSGIKNSRVLYFGSAGLALLLTLLLNSAFGRPKLRCCWALALGILLVVGLEKNIGAWQWDSQSMTNFLADLKRVEPSPRPDTAFYFASVPEMIEAVPFFTCCLQDAVRFNYGDRTDITADRLSSASLASQPNAVMVGWYDEVTLEYVLLGTTRNPKVIRIH